MGQAPHGGATTVHAIRAAIQRSNAPLQELAQQHGLNRTTVRKRRGRNFVDDAPIRLGRTPKRFIRDPSAPPPD
jgi:hypothetical protein